MIQLKMIHNNYTLYHITTTEAEHFSIVYIVLTEKVIILKLPHFFMSVYPILAS